MDDFQPELGLVAAKAKISADGDYGLSGERYRETKIFATRFPTSPIGRICVVNPRKSELSEMSTNTIVSFVPMADINENSIAFVAKEHRTLGDVGPSYTYFADNDVLLAKVTPCFENGKAGIAKNLKNGVGFGSSEFYVLRSSEGVLPEYLYFCVTHPLFRQAGIDNMTGTGGLQRVPRKFVEEYQIPLPPLEVQKEIVAEIEGYQKVIDGARAVVENYRPQIAIDSEWPVAELGEVCSIGGKVTKNINPLLPYFGADSIESNTGKLVKMESAQTQGVTGPVYEFTGECLLYSKIRPYLNKLAVIDTQGYCSSDMYPLVPDSMRVKIAYLAAYLLSEAFNQDIRHHYERASIPKINRSQLFSSRIPLPPLKAQRQIVAEIEAEQALVDGNRELIARFERKIQDAIGRVWGEAHTV